jgi:hypothetical protein
MTLAEDHGADPSLIDLHPLDPIGGDRAFDQSVLTQRLQPLRRLSCEEFLLTAVFGEIVQQPDGGCRDLGRLREKLF